MALVLSIQHWRPWNNESQHKISRIGWPNFSDMSLISSTRWGQQIDRVADALCRREEDKELQVIYKPFWQDVAKIDEEVRIRADPVLSKIREDLQLNPDSHPHYTLEHERLYYKGRLVLAAN